MHEGKIESEAAMTHVKHLSLDSILRAIRGTVCPICYQRPAGSEQLGNGVARACEGTCPIFVNVPALYRIAVHTDTSAPGAMETALREQICRRCTLSPTAGDQCVEFANRTCPLSRFSREVVSLIETLREWQHHAANGT
jgi:hypothetical protein